MKFVHKDVLLVSSIRPKRSPVSFVTYLFTISVITTYQFQLLQHSRSIIYQALLLLCGHLQCSLYLVSLAEHSLRRHLKQKLSKALGGFSFLTLGAVTC